MTTNNKVTYLSPSDSICPICGSHNIQSISRVTGYLSLDERFGPGKCEERSLRVDHNGKHQNNYQNV
jgi:ribonucleoside-triphosphate reductase